MGHNYIFKPGRNYVYRRRVPGEVSHLDKRKEVKVSLKTSDEKEALRRADIHNAHFEDFWKALVRSGNAHGLEEKYQAAVTLARQYGFAYRVIDDVARLPLNEIGARLDKAKDRESVQAVLGGVPVPKITLESCAEKYWLLAVDKMAGKNEHKKSKWKNPRLAAIKTFISVTGNKSITEVTRADVLLLKEHWREKIATGMNADTANKAIRYVKEMLQAVSNANQIDIDFDVLFTKTRFSVTVNSRPPFEALYVQKTLLPGLKDLYEDARLAIFAIADTGARPSEIIGLTENDIRLKEKIPFIWIRGNLKTKTSERQIPLVGAALYAFKKRPEGFKYWTNADSFSNIANIYLRENKLLPTPEHKVYSLRHTFKDRLRDIEAPEEIIDDLMGHKKSGPKYGRGHKLETKQKWLKKIAYKI